MDDNRRCEKVLQSLLEHNQWRVRNSGIDGAEVQKIPGSVAVKRDRARTTNGFGATERDEQAAQLCTVFQADTDHFEASLLRANESHDRLHADGTQAGGDS